jgi:hypothetical protein
MRSPSPGRRATGARLRVRAACPAVAIYAFRRCQRNCRNRHYAAIRALMVDSIAKCETPASADARTSETLMARTYRQLDLDQRRTLFRLVEARRPVGEIAARLGRHPSTIYRELGRNRFRDGDRGSCGYFPLTAQDLADWRRQRRRKPAADGGRLVAAADRRSAQAAAGGRRPCRLPRDHLPARLRSRGPRGRALPPPAQGAPAARTPIRPQGGSS